MLQELSTPVGFANADQMVWDRVHTVLDECMFVLKP